VVKCNTKAHREFGELVWLLVEVLIEN
jgi:hypothetical protein